MRMLAGSLVCIVLLAGAIVSHAMGPEENIMEEEMDLTLEDLFDIDVSIAVKTKERISDTPDQISVITHDELERFGSTTSGNVLKQVMLKIFWTRKYGSQRGE